MNRPSPTGPRPDAEHREARLALGALVLGALDPAERTTVEMHVSTCTTCTAELADLAVIPGLLRRLSPEQAAAVATGHPDPPDELLQRILSRARARRARGRRVAAWTAAAVAAAAGVVWFVAAGPLASTDHAPAVVVVEGWDKASDVHGKVSLRPTPNGTQVALVLEGVQPGEECRLVAGTADGRWEVASTWQATYQGEATVTGSTALALADIDRLAIRTADGRTLLDLPVPG